MTAADLLHHVSRMDRKWRKRFSDDDRLNEATEFAHVLRYYRPQALQGGVDACIREEAHYPTPGKLKAYVSEAEARLPQVKSAEADLPTGLCPGCRTYIQERVSWRQVARTRFDDPDRIVEVAGTLVQVPLCRQTRDMCDCQWRGFLRTKHDIELAVLGTEDPFVRDEMRRRAATPQRKQTRLGKVTEMAKRPEPKAVGGDAKARFFGATPAAQ